MRVLNKGVSLQYLLILAAVIGSLFTSCNPNGQSVRIQEFELEPTKPLLEVSECEFYTEIIKEPIHKVPDNINLLNGQEYLDNDLLKITTPDDKMISTNLTWYFPNDFKVQNTLETKFRHEQSPADYLMARLKCFDQYGKLIYESKKRKRARHSKNVEILFSIPCDAKKKLKAGKHTLTIHITGNMCTFFGTPHPDKLFDIKFKRDVEIPVIHKSTIFFKEFAFSKKSLDSLYATGNDFGNPKPEAGWKMKLNNRTQYSNYIRNSTTYKIKKSFEIYHKKNDEVLIIVYDKDYFLNSDDYMGSKTVNITDLHTDTYKNIKVPSTEYFYIYAKYRGAVNE